MFAPALAPDTTLRYRQYPMNRWFERRFPLPKEYRHVSARYRPDLFVFVQPPNLEAESVSVMLLCAFDISAQQLQHWLAESSSLFPLPPQSPLTYYFMQQEYPRGNQGTLCEP